MSAAVVVILEYGKGEVSLTLAGLILLVLLALLAS